MAKFPENGFLRFCPGCECWRQCTCCSRPKKPTVPLCSGWTRPLVCSERQWCAKWPWLNWPLGHCLVCSWSAKNIETPLDFCFCLFSGKNSFQWILWCLSRVTTWGRPRSSGVSSIRRRRSIILSEWWGGASGEPRKFVWISVDISYVFRCCSFDWPLLSFCARPTNVGCWGKCLSDFEQPGGEWMGMSARNTTYLIAPTARQLWLPTNTRCSVFLFNLNWMYHRCHSVGTNDS